MGRKQNPQKYTTDGKILNFKIGRTKSKFNQNIRDKIALKSFIFFIIVINKKRKKRRFVTRVFFFCKGCHKSFFLSFIKSNV